ncbi:MAG: glycosyltransferase [Clostridia bacterium]|nr:glycosyltransferase [Clostridia bacterium]
MKKKILVFNGYYVPAKNYGGPTTSMVTIVDHCSEDNQFYIVAANHDLNDSKIFDGINEGWNSVGKAQVLYTDTKQLRWNPKAISNLIEEVQPDMVWLVGIMVPYTKWPIAAVCRKKRIPYLISPRGEVCENAISLKHTKKKAIVTLANLLGVYKGAYYHSTSDEETEGLVKYFKAPRERIFFASNIAKASHAVTREIEKESGSLKMVFISRIQEKKNILTAIQAANKLKGNIVFDIYGPMESEEYWAKCEDEIRKSPRNVTIRHCGALPAEKVAETFSKYHCFAFPTLSENYGHTIAEALSVSCPVLLSKGTTPWDDLNVVAGFTHELNNVEMLADGMQRLVDTDQVQYNQLITSTGQYFNKRMQMDGAVQNHLNMLKQVMSVIS